MSSEWKNRDEKDPFDILEELKQIEKIVNELEERNYENSESNRRNVYILVIADPKQKNPLVDVFDEKDKVLIVAELPNTKKDDIELEEETDGSLTIYVNKHQRRLFRTIELVSKVNVEEAKINCQNGVLTVALPKVA